MGRSNLTENVLSQVSGAVRRLLNEQDLDPYSPTYGCFDRRFWAWKLVDYPEATFQRGVYPLALLYADSKSEFFQSSTVREAILAGLRYAAGIQNRDGSFNQAFPHEHSFGATAFLLHSLLSGFKIVRDDVDEAIRYCIERCLQQSAEFLCSHDEEHGTITNHMAGATLSLLGSADYFQQARYQQRADELLDRILRYQSPEGWFLEYEGADPGYQTLCLYYLAQIYQQRSSQALEQALRQAVDFLSYFVHPDGTFGGEYGSRRTAIFYPGGPALLSRYFPVAFAITHAMCNSICAGHTVILRDIDTGNLVPLLMNYICTMKTGVLNGKEDVPFLPWEHSTIRQDFPLAGLHIRGTERYYAILGVSNGGVLKVFDKRNKQPLWDDGGYIAELANGTLVTTQVTVPNRPCTVGEDDIILKSDFYKVLSSLPTPLKFVLLRLLNLTLMRSLWLGNVVKKILVKVLISGKRRYPMQLQRRVQFEPTQVLVEDRLSKSADLAVKWMEFGRKFVGIHMASARYFGSEQLGQLLPAPQIDLDRLNQQQHLDVRVVIKDSYA